MAERWLWKLGQQEPEQKASTVGFLHERNKALKLSLNRAPGAEGGVCTGGDPSVPLVPGSCSDMAGPVEVEAITLCASWAFI